MPVSLVANDIDWAEQSTTVLVIRYFDERRAYAIPLLVVLVLLMSQMIVPCPRGKLTLSLMSRLMVSCLVHGKDKWPRPCPGIAKTENKIIQYICALRLLEHARVNILNYY